MDKNYQYYTITELSELIRKQKVTASALVQDSLKRIAEWQPKINAFITILSDQALAEAQHADKEIQAGKWRGPLHGIPVAVKDFYDTAGIRTTAGFEHFVERTPEKDAEMVTRLKAAGAIIIGKTNMHRLGMGTTSLESAFGPVHNPWDTAYIAGGSSGGSAAAVAAGLCYATIDTDAVGSCRLPSACCGVVGYKCTWGRLDNSGILADQPPDPIILKLATVGITTRSVEDTILLSSILSDQAAKATTHHTLRIGVVNNFGADQETRAHFAGAVQVFEKLNYKLIDTTAPFSQNPDMQHIDESRKTVDSLFKDIDVMILPTLANAVPRITDLSADPQGLSPQNTFFVNYFGLPAISVPCGFDSNGLPCGLQVVGKLDGDNTVWAVAKVYQEATQWRVKHPA